MNTSEQINELATALSKTQGEMGHASKDTSNPFFKSKYADLASVIDASRPSLAKNNLSVSQVASCSLNGWVVISRLMHSSGQWIEGSTPILNTKGDAQGFGSAMTYARRYGMSALIGLTQDDDDANDASNKKATAIKEKADDLGKFEESSDSKRAAEWVKSGKKATKAQVDFLTKFALSKGTDDVELLNAMFKKFNVGQLEDLTMTQVQQALESFGFVSKK